MVETVEAFCAEHSVSIDEVLFQWGHRKFESLYEAYAKRKIADELSQKRSLEIAAMWGNTNLDSKDNPDLRNKWMEQIDKRYSDMIARLYGEQNEDEVEEEVDPDDPFWQAMNRGIEKRKLPQG